MKKIVLLLVIGLSISSYNDCNAQRLLRNITNKAKNKVEERVNKKIEEKAEEKIDEAIDKKLDEVMEESDSTSRPKETPEERDNRRAMNIMNRLGVNSTPVEIEDDYNFNSNIKIQIETYSDDKLENTGNINSFFNDGNNVFAYEFTDEENKDQKGFFIFDQDNQASIILSEENGEKRGIVTGINLDQLSGYAKEESNTPDNDEVFTKAKSTGRTKTILGYRCEEYEYNDEYGQSKVWISKDKVWKTQNLYSSIYNNSSLLSGYPGGFIMEAVSIDTETGEKSIMRVTEINENISKKIDLSNYEIMNMGSINIPQKE